MSLAYKIYEGDLTLDSQLEDSMQSNEAQEDIQKGVLASNLEVGHYFIRFPEPGQLNRPLLKFMHVITPPGKARQVVAMNLDALEQEFIGWNDPVLIIHF